MSNKDRIMVDFDDTLTTGEGPPYWDGENFEQPNEEMVEWVNQKYEEGNFIVIWTARPWSQAGQIASHLAEWGVKYYGIRCAKGGADLYVDDKAKRPEEVVE